MGRKAREGLAARVRGVRDQIARWRRTREKRSPMPPELWEEAVVLARSEGTYQIARTLTVDYQALARRVAEAGGGSDRGVGRTGAFVEVSGAQLLGGSTLVGPVVELCNRDGVRLTIRLASDEKLDVAGLVHALCRRGA
jgi:hypothetical protein